MKKLIEFKKFESFLLERNDTHVKRESAIADVVTKIKDKFGTTAKDFITSTKERGVDEIQDFIVKTVEPYLDQTEGHELLYDYDGLLSGLVSWILFELQLKLDEKR